VVEDAPRQQHETPPDEGRANDDGAAPAGAFGDAWEFGVAASAAMAERVEKLYRSLPAGGTGRGELDAELRSLRMDVERAADVMLELFDRALALVRRLDRVPPAEQGGVDGELVVSVVPGGRGRAELWAHNVSDDEHPMPKLRCGPLTDWEGRELPPNGVHVDSRTSPIEQRNSRCIALLIDVPPDVAPGSYRGLLLAQHDPAVAIRVRVDVVSP
jgi:hypothetical protein